ncbi:Mdm33 family-domain-containing protein [Ampelomyces quisqualis]|uniref:Sensitive to high expression protein 9, mitochondrial n=1 Tax=Ampelomyces quisqualis TaxID=50730 RepID=A0A6A5QYY1_AMPQU|nr:Mdm33 family-domain-containing protein [Ampelomyces quisqualis]
MRPLLQHASRSFTARRVSAAPPPRLSFQVLNCMRLSICLQCQYRTATLSQRNGGRIVRTSSIPPSGRARRSISSSVRWRDETRPSNSAKPIHMAPPTTDTKPTHAGRVEDTAPESVSSPEGQERLQDAPDALVEKDIIEESGRELPGAVTQQQQQPPEAQNQPQADPASRSRKDDVADNITRVPDEHLPSHRERQRWSLSKRFSEAMDELLPKLAVVTQKVNTYTGTDYSGVEALRREIKEQENLVKARRAAIDIAKHSLDTAHAQQASAQKEVVALLERKHSWSAGDLERYMSLIRSEHINDQAIRLAKESVINAEAALEEARTQLEKRERAQYHEEQIWSDTIRRNSTWVTFGLMGVNIFLLLLSLAILEPWRRRRMVREIKGALEAQQVAANVATASLAPAMPTSTPQHDIATIEEELDRVNDAAEEDVQSAAPALSPVAEDPPFPERTGFVATDASLEQTEVLASVIDPALGVAAPGVVPQTSSDIESPPHTSTDRTEAASAKLQTWQSKFNAVAQDVISDRVISMRRIDYTTAILQGAAAGAVITAALIGMFGPS